MQTIKTQVSDSELSSTISLKEELKGVPKDARNDLLSNIGELIVEQVLLRTAEQTSPVAGLGRFKSLSKDYAKIKADETGSKDANLDLTGSMLGSLDFKVDGDKITVGVFGADAGKADGHNNFSGSSNLPTRRFLPGEGQSFKSDIQELIKDEINLAKANSAQLDKKVLSEIETSKELYAYLSEELGIAGKAVIRDTVLGSELQDLLDAYDLMDLL